MTAAARRRRRLLTALMAGGLIALLLEATVDPGRWAEASVGRFADDVVISAAAMLCLLRALEDGRRCSAWVLLGAALGAWAFGAVYQSLFVWGSRHAGVGPADMAWLLLYPLSGLAFLGFAHDQLGRLDLRLGIDVLIGALALLAFLAGDLLETLQSSVDPRAAWVSIAYSVGDLLLVALSVAIGSANRWQLDRLWGVLLAGFMVTVVGDLLYARDVAMGTFDSATVVTATWSCGAALIGLSSWVALPPPRHDRRRAGAIGLPIVLAFGALAIVIYSSVAPVAPAAILLAAGSLCACLVRLALTHRDNAVLLDEAEEHARVDPLTGLGNRRAFARDLERVAAALDDGSRLRLTLFDLDGFKGYNDRHGHLAGDELLARVARQMRAAVAGQGLCYRLGGDEFCLLMAIADGQQDAVSAQAAAALTDENTEAGVGCSYGSVTMRRDTTLTEALRMADERMYAHKRIRRGGAAPDGSAGVLIYVEAPDERRAHGHRRNG